MDKFAILCALFEAGNGVGDEEVGDGENPQGVVAAGYFGERRSVAADVDKALHCPSGWHEPAHHSPKSGNGIQGPCEAGEEDEYHREEHHEEECVFALASEVLHYHPKEYCREEERNYENVHLDIVAGLRDVDEMRYEVEVENRHDAVDCEVA